MHVVRMQSESAIKCPRCGSEAWYHFGRTAAGKRRYICQVCGRQFITDYSCKHGAFRRPCCSRCGSSMHIYMRAEHEIRFRCARYPACRGFAKLESRPRAAGPASDFAGLPCAGASAPQHENEDAPHDFH